MLKARGSLASGECEVHLYRRFHFHRFAVQQVRLVLPLLHSFDGRGRQHGMAADQTEVLNVTRLADLRLKDNGPLNASLPRQRWVRWLNALHQKAVRHTGGNAGAAEWPHAARPRAWN